MTVTTKNKFRKLGFLLAIYGGLFILLESSARFLTWRPWTMELDTFSYRQRGSHGDCSANVEGIVVIGKRSFYLKTNSQGLRNDETEFVVPKPDHIFRIVCVGDSITFGSYVDNWETYPYLLRQDLHRRGYEAVEVVNAGYGGYGLDDEMAYIMSKGIRLEPDLILFQPLGNDLDVYLMTDELVSESMLTRLDPMHDNIFDKIQYEILKHDRYSGLATGFKACRGVWSNYQWKRHNRRKVALTEHHIAWAASRGIPESTWNDYEKMGKKRAPKIHELLNSLYAEHFERLVKFVADNDVQLAMLLIGRSNGFRKIAEQNRVPTISTHGYFSRMPFPEVQTLHPIDPHHSKYGNAIIAEAVSHWLVESQTLPPPAMR